MLHTRLKTLLLTMLLLIGQSLAYAHDIEHHWFTAEESDVCQVCVFSADADQSPFQHRLAIAVSQEATAQAAPLEFAITPRSSHHHYARAPPWTAVLYSRI